MQPVRDEGGVVVGASESASGRWAATARTGKKVAVVGSGPAGLACAGDLARKGADVTVYEALHVVGGVLQYGIPPFRLPRDIIAREVKRLTDSIVAKSPTAIRMGKQLFYRQLEMG